MKRTLLFAIISFTLLPLTASAASVTFDMPQTAVVGQEVLVTVKIHSVKDRLNAISGTIVLDPRDLDAVRTYEGGSAVALWIQRPLITEASKTSEEISFSGITPGGFQGDFTLFSFVAKLIRPGTATITGKELSAFKNDGKGTEVNVTFVTGSIVSKAGNATSTVTIADTVAPELFKLAVSSSKDIFEGRPFVSFSAEDKGVGIDHYEVTSSLFFTPGKDTWTKVESPFVLPSGTLSSVIFIKAVDKAGNERIVSIAGPSRYLISSLWGILIVILVICAFIFTKRRSSSSQR